MRLPWLMVIVCYLILFLTDILILRDIKTMSLYDKYRPKHKQPGNWGKIYLIFAILTGLLLTVAVCFPKRNENFGIIPVMWMLYIVMTIEIAQIVYSVFSLLGYIPWIFKKERWNTGLWVGLPMAALVFVMMWWGALIGRNRIETVDVEITSTKLPESFNGYKIVQISDLHVGTWGENPKFIDKLVDSVNGLKPDLIVFTGDIVNRESSELIPFIKSLSRLKAKDGVYSILGNHDYGDYMAWDNPESKRANLQLLKTYEHAMGWKMLNNSHVSIRNAEGDSIVLIGVENWGEPPFTKYGDLRKAYPQEKLNDGNFKILLSHNPEHWNQEVSHVSNIDLTMAGHTHGMQIEFSLGGKKWSPAKYRYDQWGGLYARENGKGEETKVYVNIGSGEVGMPMRIGATPEITVFTLHSKR